MKCKRIIFEWMVMLILAFPALLHAQAPTISSFSPTKVTLRTSVTINGSNFTGVTASNVKFGGVPAASITVVSPTQIRATLAEGTNGTNLNVTVTNTGSNAGTATVGGLTYVAPAATVVNTAKITRVVTDFNGYWNSNAVSTNVALQPDTSHSMLGFEYGGTMYSTGSTTAVAALSSNGVAYTPGNYRALPINDLGGNVPATGPNLIVLASKIDGSATTQVATAPGVAGTTIRDVLIDGIRGLDLGTGVTNLPASAVLLFNASNILSAGINDNIPDILVSQVAEPTDSAPSIYAFTDSNGNIVGVPIMVSINAVPAIGRYKTDFFKLPIGAPLNSAAVSGSTTIGANTRDIRLVAYKLSEFGITDANKDDAVYFKVMPGGTSDPAFMGYNRDAFNIPAPLITQQPVSQAACTNANNNVTFSVTATGSELDYQWEKNGMDIAGANSASYTVTNIQPSDVGTYRVTVSNSGGTALSDYAYINTVITVQPVSASTCQNAPISLDVTANGAGLMYQWYANTANSNTGGTPIPVATSDTYAPPVDMTGTKYYYVVINNNNLACTNTTSDAVAVHVGTQNTWTGAVSTAWNTPENWSCGQVPTLTTDAYIPMVSSENYPVIDGSDGIANTRNITVSTNANVLVTGNGAGILKIAGTITNNGAIDAIHGTLFMKGTTAQIIPEGDFQANTLYGLTIDNPAGVTLDGPIELTGVLTLANGTFRTNNVLTLKSNAGTTSMIAPVTGAIAGTMVIERYIPARRAFRLISSPVDGGTINDNWQEDFETAAGLGTDITGTGGTANGFDASGSNNPSLFTFDNSATEWNAVQSTQTANLIAGMPYRLLLRGDRTVDQTNNSAAPTHTTLRSTGTIKTGTVTDNSLNQAAGKWNFIGNPYQAPVNMVSVIGNSTNVNPNFYYVWDPTLGGTPVVGQPGGRGAYVTVMLPQGTNASHSAANKYLQPNQAAFVQTLVNGAASVTFSESDKDLLTNTTPNVYRTSGSNASASVSLQLYDANSLSLNDTPADGLIVEFSDAYSNTIDSMDAPKMTNQDENVALSAGNGLLSVERRAMPVVADVLQLHNSQYRKTNYTYTIAVDGLESSTAYLVDNYTSASTELVNGSETLYNFSVNAQDTASVDPNRFKIVFSQEALGTGSNALSNALRLYPNPSAAGEAFFIEAGSTADSTTIAIYNALGQTVNSTTEIQSGTLLKVVPQSTMAAGIYMVTIAQGAQTTTKKLIIL